MGLIASPFNKEVLLCSASIRDELLASINTYAEIKDGGRELLKANGHQALAKAYLRFQAYIRQAKAFYESAENLHHRAGALNYYYSFLNFAKAFIFLKTPTFIENNIHHGITPRPTTGSLKKQRVIIKKDGVLPRFYKLIANHSIAANAEMKISDLLGYCSDVQHEYYQFRFGEPASFSCKVIIERSVDEKHAFPTVAIKNGQHPSFEKLRRYLEKHFEEVSADKQRVRERFGMLAEEQRTSRFFEGRDQWTFPITHDKIAEEISSFFPNLISYSPYNDGIVFTINRPIKTPNPTPMQESIAIYCCMFFLGSLVRYRPELLEGMLSTKDAWIIERFIKSAPLTFLRLIRNLFDGQYLAFASR